MALRSRGRWAAALAVATLATGAAAAAPAVNGASSKSVNATVKVSGIPSFSGTVSGKPYGRGTVRGRLDLPTLRATLRYPGGTVRITGKVSSASPVRGTWRTSGGTGRFRSVSGGGSFSGTFNGTRATLKFRGRVR